MVLALKREELVNSRNCYGVIGMDSKRAPVRQGIRAVADPRSARRHGRGSRDRAIMHEARDGEVPPPKGRGDLRHVSPDLGDAGWIIPFTHQGDAPAISQRLEAMRGGVLVYSHGQVASGLHQGEGAIVG